MTGSKNNKDAQVSPPGNYATRAQRRKQMISERKDTRRNLEKQQKRQRLLTRAGFAIAVLIILGVLASVIVPPIIDAVQQPPEGVESFEDLEKGHVQEPVTYEQTPPVGGRHAPAWQTCGYYPAPIANENGVHSLEHGAVWITYRPDLPEDQVTKLREMTEDTTYVLTAPYPDLPAPVVASSWGKQILLDSANDDRLDAFIREYRQGPDTPELGATCSGGVTTTQ